MSERAQAVGSGVLGEQRSRAGHLHPSAVRSVTRTTVIVVDDHDLLREGVSACLARFDDLEVIGEAGSGELR